MESPTPLNTPDENEPGPSVPAPHATGRYRMLVHSIRTRIISGLVLALPIVLTFWIIYWLYTTLTAGILDPLAELIGPWVQAPWARTLWWRRVVNPVLAILLTLGFLYFLGSVGQSWVTRLIDAVLFRVPVVTTIYKGLRNVFQSLANQFQQQQSQRVVLVEFPHAGSRALAFVTNSVRDASTGKTILSVCVLTGVFPPAGFTLFVPEEAVTELDWTVNQALQAIISGGTTAPGTIPFSKEEGAGPSFLPLPPGEGGRKPGEGRGVASDIGGFRRP